MLKENPRQVNWWLIVFMVIFGIIFMLGYVKKIGVNRELKDLQQELLSEKKALVAVTQKSRDFDMAWHYFGRAKNDQALKVASEKWRKMIQKKVEDTKVLKYRVSEVFFEKKAHFVEMAMDVEFVGEWLVSMRFLYSMDSDDEPFFIENCSLMLNEEGGIVMTAHVKRYLWR